MQEYIKILESLHLLQHKQQISIKLTQDYISEKLSIKGLEQSYIRLHQKT